jgi:hypothetical protein
MSATVIDVYAMLVVNRKTFKQKKDNPILTERLAKNRRACTGVIERRV